MINKKLLITLSIFLVLSLGFVNAEIFTNPNFVNEEVVCDACDVCEICETCNVKCTGKVIAGIMGGILITLAFINFPKRKKKKVVPSVPPKEDQELNQLIKDTGLEDIKEDVEILK